MIRLSTVHVFFYYSSDSECQCRCGTDNDLPDHYAANVMSDVSIPKIIHNEFIEERIQTIPIKVSVRGGYDLQKMQYFHQFISGKLLFEACDEVVVMVVL